MAQLAQVFLTHAPGSDLSHGFVGGESWTHHVFSFKTDEAINIFAHNVSLCSYERHKFKIRDQEAVHFVTFTTIHWLDPLKRNTCFYSTGISRYFSGKHSLLPKKQRAGIICILYDEQPRTHDRCQAWQTNLEAVQSEI